VNHDALFKMLLKSPAILKGFFEAFLPQIARFIDFGHLEFVDKERITASGKKRTGDLLIKTRFRGKSAGFLIHLEHQAQPDTDLGRRMLEYLLLDWQEYNLPVYPIAVLSHKQAAAGMHVPLEIRFPNKRVLQFDFDVIDLPRMEAGSFVKLRNPAALALASRMKVDPKARVGLARDFFLSLAGTAIRRKEKEFVAGFFSRYQPLTAQEALQLEREVGKVKPEPAREAVMNLTNPFIELGKQRGLQQGLQQGLQRGREQGREQGLQQGRQQGEADLVLKQIARRLGAISSSQEKAVRRLPLRKIEALGEALLDFTSVADLSRWLRNN
jgi:predicted transposase YdaD